MTGESASFDAQPRFLRSTGCISGEGQDSLKQFIGEFLLLFKKWKMAGAFNQMNSFCGALIVWGIPKSKKTDSRGRASLQKRRPVRGIPTRAY